MGRRANRSRRSSYGGRSTREEIIALVAQIVIAYFIVIPVLITSGMGVVGSIAELIAGIVDLIPFGNALFDLAAGMMTHFFGSAGTLSINIKPITAIDVVQDIAKAFFAAIIYQALNVAVQKFMELGKSSEGWKRIRYLFMLGFNAILAAFFAPIPINYIFSSLSQLHIVWQMIISLLVAAILVGGGFFFFHVVLNSLPLLTLVLFLVCKYVVVGFVRMLASYVLVLLVLIGIETGTWEALAVGLSGGGALILMLIGLNLIFKAGFGDAWD